jgi:BolA protein
MEERLAKVEAALRRGFDPVHLEIEDQTHRHAGHEGAKSGGSHYRVTIVSDRFRGLSRIERHRVFYDALGEMMGGEIHALAVRARTPEEWKRETSA